jgi:hypothetical protein
MKIRQGFVSNSSSSSFIIGKSKLSLWQIDLIYNHIEVAKARFPQIVWCNRDDEWNILETVDYIKGETSMDNFDMEKFLWLIGINNNDIEWGY